MEREKARAVLPEIDKYINGLLQNPEVAFWHEGKFVNAVDLAKVMVKSANTLRWCINECPKDYALTGKSVALTPEVKASMCTWEDDFSDSSDE